MKEIDNLEGPKWSAIAGLREALEWVPGEFQRVSRRLRGFKDFRGL